MCCVLGLSASLVYILEAKVKGNSDLEVAVFSPTISQFTVSFVVAVRWVTTSLHASLHLIPMQDPNKNVKWNWPFVYIIFCHRRFKVWEKRGKREKLTNWWTDWKHSIGINTTVLSWLIKNLPHTLVQKGWRRDQLLQFAQLRRILKAILLWEVGTFVSELG